MSVALTPCSDCGNRLVSDAIYCPHCLIERVEVEDSWFPVSGEGASNPVVEHSMVPEHRIVPEERIKQLCREYSITPTDLPFIKTTDPAIQHLACGAGDVIEIIRDSRTTDTARTYRLVVSPSSGRGESRETSEWRNPAGPAADTYSGDGDLSASQALHIIENLRAHIPPSQPGACRQIAIDRQSEMETAKQRVDSASPYTFIEGELGFGKSFFLYWIRDEVLPATAVSIIDLDDRTNFLNPESLIESFRVNLETPRSLDHEEYANGLDELWDTTLRKIADLCASHYERQGFEVREDRMKKSLQLAAEDILSEADLPEVIIDEVATTAGTYFDDSRQSLSQSLLNEVSSGDPHDVLRLIGQLARINGYRVLLGVDELEKSIRTRDHFEAIDEFVQDLPENISLFVTGTPELVEGEEEGNAIKELHSPLYEVTTQNRIQLESPSRQDLTKFSRRVMDIETQALESQRDREYTLAIETAGGSEKAVETFLEDRSPAFRAYLDYLEQYTLEESATSN